MSALILIIINPKAQSQPHTPVGSQHTAASARDVPAEVTKKKRGVVPFYFGDVVGDEDPAGVRRLCFAQTLAAM